MSDEKKPDGGPAFYVSTRTWIAATVIAGIATHPGSHEKVEGPPGKPCDSITDNCRVAVLYADRLLAALEEVQHAGQKDGTV